MSTAIVLPTGLFAGTPAVAGSVESASDVGTKSPFDAFQGLFTTAKNEVPTANSSTLEEGVANQGSVNKFAKELEDISANPINAALWAAFLPVQQNPLLLSPDNKTLATSFIADTSGSGSSPSRNSLPSAELHSYAVTNVNSEVAMNTASLVSEQVIALPDAAAISFTPDGQTLPTLTWQTSTASGLALNLKSDASAVFSESEVLSKPAQITVIATSVDGSSPQIDIAPDIIPTPSLSAESVQHSSSIKAESSTVFPSRNGFPKLPESIQLGTNTLPTSVATQLSPAMLQQESVAVGSVPTPQPVAIPLTLTAQQPTGLVARRSAAVPGESRARNEKMAATLPTQGKGLPSSISTSLPVSLVHATFQAKDSSVEDPSSANVNSLISSISDKARSSSAESRMEQVAQTIQPAAITDAPVSGANSLSSMPLPTTSTAPTLETPVTHTLSPSVGTPEWGQSLGEHIVWLTDQNTQQARINLHPHGMGHMQVNVNLEQDRISLRFDVQHPAVAAAVQDSLPQLQALLSQHGLTLGQASVSQQDAGQARHGAFVRDYATTATTIEGSEEPAPLAVTRSRTGLIDDFA